MNEKRIEAEKRWRTSFQQLVFGLVCGWVVYVMVAPIFGGMDDMSTDAMLLALALLPIGYQLWRRYELRCRFDETKRRLYRQALLRDLAVAVSFVMVLNQPIWFTTDLAFSGMLIVLGIGIGLHRHVERRLIERDPAYARLRLKRR